MALAAGCLLKLTMLPYERFRQGVLLALVALGSSLVTHAYSQGNYVSVLTTIFLIFLLISALYRSRQEMLVMILLLSLAYAGYHWYFLPVITKESLTLIAGTVFLFLVVGLVAHLVFDWLKYALPRLEELNLTDKETGVWNATQIKKLLKVESEKRRRYGSVSSFLLLSFPDSLDKKSLEVCHRLIKLVRKNIRLVDEIGRVSKSHFLIILPETSTKNAGHLKDRLEKLAGHFFASEKEVAFQIEIFESADEVFRAVGLEKNE